MSKEAIEKIAEEFVRQPQCIDEDISINFISRINPKSSAQIEYCKYYNIIVIILILYVCNNNKLITLITMLNIYIFRYN